MKVLPHCVFLVIICSFTCAAQQRESDLLPNVFKNNKGETLPYRLFIPPDYNSQRKYPLVVYLHGGGGVGNDNRKQIQGGNSYLIDLFTDPDTQTKNPAFVLAPQSDGDGWVEAKDLTKGTRQLHLVVELIESLRKTYNIDVTRLYVSGQSLGGFGSFAIVSEYPQLFAAAIPLCGGGDELKAARLTSTRWWVFHGEKDTSVPVGRSRSMVAAIKKAGGQVKYTEYAGEGHIIWTKVVKERGLLEWMFLQHQ